MAEPTAGLWEVLRKFVPSAQTLWSLGAATVAGLGALAEWWRRSRRKRANLRAMRAEAPNDGSYEQLIDRMDELRAEVREAATESRRVRNALDTVHRDVSRNSEAIRDLEKRVARGEDRLDSLENGRIPNLEAKAEAAVAEARRAQTARARGEE